MVTLGLRHPRQGEERDGRAVFVTCLSAQRQSSLRQAPRVPMIALVEPPHHRTTEHRRSAPLVPYLEKEICSLFRVSNPSLIALLGDRYDGCTAQRVGDSSPVPQFPVQSLTLLEQRFGRPVITLSACHRALDVQDFRSI